jgi:polyphosphate kinase
MDSLAKSAAFGNVCRVIIKMNALTDEALIECLIRVGQQGVHIDLIVRGACMLPAQLPGQTDNIRVRSVIGRFLEHSRVFYFQDGEQEEMYLSSADWMNRNMVRRVELAWPVTDAAQRQRLKDECLTVYMQDPVDAWDLGPDGTYARAKLTSRKKAVGAQSQLMSLYSRNIRAQ